MTGITRRQRDLLAFLKRFISEHGHSPNFDEIAAAMGIRSRSGVKRHVDSMAQRGLITRLPYCSRSITLTPHGNDWATLVMPRETSRVPA